MTTGGTHYIWSVIGDGRNGFKVPAHVKYNFRLARNIVLVWLVVMLVMIHIATLDARRANHYAPIVGSTWHVDVPRSTPTHPKHRVTRVQSVRLPDSCDTTDLEVLLMLEGHHDR